MTERYDSESHMVRLRHFNVHGATVLRERHGKRCTCSYCLEQLKGRVGIALPADKSVNSWRVLYWRWHGRLHVLRWTLPRRTTNRERQ